MSTLSIQTKKSDWRSSNLNGQLKLLEGFFPADINERISAIRILGNKGAHQDKHKQLSDEGISVSLSDLSRICEWTILSYFKKHGFTIKLEGLWKKYSPQ